MEKKFLRLFEIASGEICPDTGTWYANLKEETSFVSFDSAKKIIQGSKFPEFNNRLAKWTYFIQIN